MHFVACITERERELHLHSESCQDARKGTKYDLDFNTLYEAPSPGQAAENFAYDTYPEALEEGRSVEGYVKIFPCCGL